jgi:thiamine-phosphate pyrophosphorylase
VNFELPKIYPITDSGISGVSLLEQTEKLIAGGARLIQLREKYGLPREFYDSAKVAIQLARKSDVRIIVNDRADIALALLADGVHLGQDDLPPEKAREILGPGAIIGYSTHSVEQAAAAMGLPVDYIAIGPIFRTQTKENPDDTVGLDALRQVRDLIGNFPIVAIGGIDDINIRSVFSAGADSASMIGAIVSDPSIIEERMLKFHQLATESAKCCCALLIIYLHFITAMVNNIS